MKRAGELRRKSALRARRRKVSETEAALRGLWHDAVIAKAPRDRDGRRLCAVTGKPESAGDRLTCHHVLERSKIREEARRLGVPEEELLWDPRCGLPVLWSRHERHTSRVEPIPIEALLPENVEFAEALGLGWLLERIYASSA